MFEKILKMVTFRKKNKFCFSPKIFLTIQKYIQLEKLHPEKIRNVLTRDKDKYLQLPEKLLNKQK